MGAIVFISLGLMMLLGLPTLTYFYAKHLGRNAKLWFLIGIVLPGLATLILSFLPDLSEAERNTSSK